MKKVLFFIILLLFTSTGCKKKYLSEDIRECDSMGNYYENGEHYFSREFLNDEEGTLRYDKIFEKMDRRNAKCNPTNTFTDE